MSEGEGLASRMQQMMEQYTAAALVTILGLFALEMVTLITLIDAGVDLEPALATLDSWTGWQTAALLSTAGTWAIAYAITRVLKPLQIMVALPLIPLVAKGIDRVRGVQPAADVEPEGTEPEPAPES